MADDILKMDTIRAYTPPPDWMRDFKEWAMEATGARTMADREENLAGMILPEDQTELAVDIASLAVAFAFPGVGKICGKFADLGIEAFTKIAYRHPAIRNVARLILKGDTSSAIKELESLGIKVLDQEQAQLFIKNLHARIVGPVGGFVEIGTNGQIWTYLGRAENWARNFFGVSGGFSTHLHEVKHIEQALLRGARGLYGEAELVVRTVSEDIQILIDPDYIGFAASEIVPYAIQLITSPFVRVTAVAVTEAELRADE